MQFSGHVNIAIQAARKAGDLIRRQCLRLEGIKVHRKSRHDYVTEVDQQAEKAIIETILRAFPDHAVLGEESGMHGDGEQLWVVDPLDGTMNLLHGLRQLAVSIAFKNGGQTEYGVIYDPLAEELFVAVRGKGAYLDNRRIRVGECHDLDNAVLASGLPFREPERLPAALGMLERLSGRIADLRMNGSACLSLAHVACGRLDGYFEGALKCWDIAAGALLVREAGGVVVDFTGAEEYESKGEVIAAPFKLIAPLVQQAHGPKP